MQSGTPTILKKILDHKAQEVAQRKATVSVDQLKTNIEQQEAPRGFIQRIREKVASKSPAVIAEVKKASPSKGVIREDFHPPQIAQSYQQGGATCLSVLTDENFFQGHDDYLAQAKAACSLPILRKDFIIDPYQVYETRAMGADCILLIVAAFIDNNARLEELVSLSHELGLDILLETHNLEEIHIANALPCELVGINNRDLHTFTTTLDTTINLQSHISDERIIVTESGIHTADDVQTMLQQNIYSFLVGEAFMKAPEPGEELNAMFFS